MAKIAPLAAAIGVSVPTLVGVGLSLAGSVGSTMAQNRAIREQDAANQQWMDYQRKQTERATARDDELRSRNEASLGRYLDQADETSRLENIDAETERLTGLYDAGLEESVAVGPSGDAVMSDAGGFGSREFRDAVGGEVSRALADARERMSALARASAYGGSYGGMGTTQSEALADAGSSMALVNEMRGRNAQTLGRYQEVQPEQLQFQSSGLGELMSGIGGSLAGAGLGADLDGILGGGMPGAASASTASPTAGAGPRVTRPSLSFAPGTGQTPPGLSFSGVSPVRPTLSKTPRLSYGLRN